MLEIELPSYAQETIIRFIKEFVQDRRVVIGLSGGLDSSVVAKLCVMALGKDRVKGIHMPEDATPSEDSRDAETLAKTLEIEYEVIPIGEFVHAIAGKLGLKGDMSIANLKARVRMAILYAIANEERRLVAGTSNKSELLVGYFTKYGDGASDFAPIGDLYKTQVRILAKKIGIPEGIINKVPRAGLLPGQSDEVEMGVKYEILDKILYGIELGLPREKIVKELEISDTLVDKVYEMHNRSRHKRVMLYIPKIGARTVNTDWRE